MKEKTIAFKIKSLLGVIMKSFGASCELALSIITAVCVYRAQEVEGADAFRRCYNTSVNMHCFDVQYTADNRLLADSFDNARRRCNNLNSTLIIIKDEETQSRVQQFMEDSYNPVRLYYIWTDAYRINDYNNTYTWHWVDSTLPNVPASNVANTPDYGWWVAAIAFGNNDFYLTAQQPHINSNYVCEYPVSNCSSSSSNNARIFSGRCYAASDDMVSWYEARNRCLKYGGDLASFANITSINFTSWLRSDPTVRYGIGLQFTWYIWTDTGEKVSYAKWTKNDNGWRLPCLIIWNGFTPSFSWSPKDCNSNDVCVVCHTVTSLNPTTTSTTSTFTSATITTTSTLTLSESFQNTSVKEPSESRTPNAVAIGVGVGVGVGVPVLIAVIVLVICIVVRKRRHETVSSVQSTNRHQRESSIDQPFEAPTENERDEIGETAYGIVVPSALSRQAAAEANGAHSATEQTVYAPLQIL